MTGLEAVGVAATALQVANQASALATNILTMVGAGKEISDEQLAQFKQSATEALQKLKSL